MNSYRGLLAEEYPSCSTSDIRLTDYFRGAKGPINADQQRYYRPEDLTVQTDNSAQQLAAVRMSQTGYSGVSGSGGGGQSMQPSHGAHHQAPQQHPQQPMPPPPHAGMSYHQQSGPPYVIGPGHYNTAQFGYRQQQPPFQQQQVPAQQHPQQSGRPAFVGVGASANPVGRLPTSHPQSTTPYFVQPQQQSASSARVPQQPNMQQPPQSFVGQPAPRMVQISSQQQPSPQQLMSGGGHGQQLIRVQHQQPSQMVHQVGGGNRMVGPPGQVQVIATSANTGMMMPGQYPSGQGVYPRPALSQQPNVNVLASQQSVPIQYQYKQQQQALVSQMQQQPSVMPKQVAASPSSSASSTPAPQFATPTSRLDVSGGSNLSPAISGMGAPSSAALDGASSGYSAAQSDSSQIVSKQRLDDLVREVDPYEQLDEDVKEALLHIADEFIESVVSSACQIAKHRKANAVDVKDVQLCLERNWNMWIPGFGTDDIRSYKKSSVTEAHKQRTALIKKTLKKI